MGKEPAEIRAEIEQTRNEMGDTVEALGYKADVKTRAKDNIADKRDRLKERITGTAPDARPVIASPTPVTLSLTDWTRSPTASLVRDGTSAL